MSSVPTRHARFALLLGLCVGSFAQDSDASLRRRFESLLQASFPSTRCPGLSVAVARGNRIVFSGSAGLADIEQNVAMTADRAHRLASLSKPITGTIVMDLVEQGKVTLDSNVRQYLPELPPAYDGVTLRRLLDHQSGVRGYTDPLAIAFSVTHFPTSRDAMKSFLSIPLAFEPGTKLEYSSLSFTVAAAVLEAVTGRSFQDLSADFFTRHNIGGFFLDDPLAIVPKRVRGYLVDPKSSITLNDGRVVKRDYLAGTSGAITNARFYDISNRYAAGGFISSAADLLQFTIAVATGKILKPETVQSMWTAQSLPSGRQDPIWDRLGRFGLQGKSHGRNEWIRAVDYDVSPLLPSNRRRRRAVV